VTEPPSPTKIPLVPKVMIGFILALLLTLGIFTYVELTREPPEYEYFPVPPAPVATNSNALPPGE
jgi:hypothetical protein